MSNTTPWWPFRVSVGSTPSDPEKTPQKPVKAFQLPPPPRMPDAPDALL